MPVNLSEDELQLLAALPQAIGSAVAFAGRSGLFGTGKEMFASGQALMAGAKDYPGNELIQAIVPDPQAADKGTELDQARKTRDWAMARMKASLANSVPNQRSERPCGGKVRNSPALSDISTMITIGSSRNTYTAPT